MEKVSKDITYPITPEIKEIPVTGFLGGRIADDLKVPKDQLSKYSIDVINEENVLNENADKDSEELVNFNDVRICYSPLSGDIFMCVLDEKGLAKIKKPCEHDLMFSLVGHMMHDSGDHKAIEKDICLGDSWYTIKVKKIEKHDEV